MSAIRFFSFLRQSETLYSIFQRTVQNKRMQATRLARSLFFRTPLGRVPAPEDELKLNKLILELSLFLPDDLVCRLSQTLCLPEHRIKYKDCFIEIRKHILGSEDKLIGENIAHVIFCPITQTQPNQKDANWRAPKAEQADAGNAPCSLVTSADASRARA